MATRSGTAVGWLQLAMVGAVLMSLGAFEAFVRVPLLAMHGNGFWSCVWAYRLRAAVYLGPFAAGLALLIWGEKRFKAGYQADLWSEAELAEVRRLLRTKLWLRVSWAVLLAWIVAMCWQHTMRGGALWYVLLMPSQLAQRIRQLITPPVPRSSGLGDWRNFGPLRSEHWGEPNA